MKENKLHAVFAPYEERVIITRPEYLKVLKKFRAMGAPYKDGLDKLVPWILNETGLHLKQDNLSDRVVELVAKILWVEGVNLADWHRMLEFYIAKNKAEKLRKNTTTISDAPREEEDNDTPIEEEAETPLGLFTSVSLGDEFVPEISTLYSVTMKGEDTINIYEGLDKKPVGSVRLDPKNKTLTTVGTIPYGLVKFFQSWIAV